MKIGLGTTMIEPAITQGQIDGVGFYAKNIWEYLQKSQQSVIPCSFPPLKQRQFKSAFSNGQTFAWPYMIATGISLFPQNIFNIHAHIEKSIDLFHATDHLVPRLKKIPVIATLHDALTLSHPEWYGAHFRQIKNWIRKSSIHWADHIITISHSMVKEMVEFWGIPENKISVVYNGLDDFWRETVPEEQRKQVIKKLNIPENFLLVVCTLQPKKNIPRIIDAFLKLPKDVREQYPLVITGKAGWNTEESLSAIERLTQSQTGYWLKYVNTEDLRALFQSTRLYMHPSLHEGFGLTLLQGFASRVPVLTSNITAMPEVAGNAAYLVDPYSIDSMQQGMLKLLTNETLCQDLIKKGLDRVQAFSWEKCAKETQHIYNFIINK